MAFLDSTAIGKMSSGCHPNLCSNTTKICRHGPPRLCASQYLSHHTARFAVREALFLAVVMVDEFGVVEPEEVQQRGVIVVRADRIQNSLVPEFISCAVGHAALD